MKRLSHLGLSLLLIAQGYSAQITISPNDLLTLELSHLGPTRITLDQEKIEDVFFYPEEAASVVLHKSGAVFVVPKPSHNELYLTVMGETGNTQDCHFAFTDKTPAPIQLVPSSLYQPKPREETHEKSH